MHCYSAAVTCVCSSFDTGPEFVAFISAQQIDNFFGLVNEEACIIGIVKESAVPVVKKNALGVEHILDRPFGDQSPRIC